MHCFVYLGKMASNELEAIKYSNGPDIRFRTRKRQISGAEESFGFRPFVYSLRAAESQ